MSLLSAAQQPSGQPVIQPPPPPPPPPAPPTMANSAVQGAGAAQAARAAAAGAYADTIRSGSAQGVTGPTTTAGKALLGN